MLQLRTLFFFSLLTWSGSLIGGDATNADHQDKKLIKEALMEGIQEQEMIKKIITKKKIKYAIVGGLIGFFPPIVVGILLGILTFFVYPLIMGEFDPMGAFFFILEIIVIGITIIITIITTIIGIVKGASLGKRKAHTILREKGITLPL